MTANVAPKLMHQMCAAALAGDAAKAAAIDDRLALLHKNLFVDPNPIPTKWALEQMGRIPGGIRLPLVPMHPDHVAVVSESLRAAGAL